MVGRTGSEAGVVEEEEVDRTVGVGAVVGRSRTGDTVRGTGLAVVGEGSIDVLAVGTGSGTGLLADDLVVLSGRDVGAALAVGES